METSLKLTISLSQRLNVHDYCWSGKAKFKTEYFVGHPEGRGKLTVA